MEFKENNPPKTLEEAYRIIIEQQKEIIQLKEKINTIQEQYENLHHQFTTLIRGKFGNKSEKLKNQGLDFPEEETEASEDEDKKPEKVEFERISYTRRKPRNGHRNIPDNIPRTEILCDLSEGERICPCGCGARLYKIGEEISEQLEYEPAKLRVNKYIRYKYAGCKHGDKVITAPMPPQPIDKGFAGPGLLANILVEKYDDHLPLYRQSERLERHGLEISRSTLCDWVIKSSFILKPLVAEIRKDVLRAPKIHTDDTPVPIQYKGGTKKSRLWVYLGCAGGNSPGVVYEYSRTREQEYPIAFLKGYKGYLQADAYTGYDALYKEQDSNTPSEIIEVGCWAHAKRKFLDVAKSSKKPGLANTALKYIGNLYKIEQEIKKLDSAEKQKIRAEKSNPILAEFGSWLNNQNSYVLPKSPLGQAITYTLNQWDALNIYTTNGILDIDNNAAERLMKPIAVGRSNWLFAGSDRGGKAAAVAYSLIETCKLNNINPYEYLRDVLTRLPTQLMKNIGELLPYNWKPLNDSS